MKKHDDWAVVLDLDDSLVLTASIRHLQRRGSWREAYAHFPDTSLPRGTKGFLRNVSRYARLGVVTTGRKKYAEKLLAYHELSIASLMVYQNTPQRRLRAETLLMAAEQLDVNPDHCIYVGDQLSDIEAAVAAGMNSIFVTWGSGRLTRKQMGMVYAVCDSWDDVFVAIVSKLRPQLPETRSPFHLKHLRAEVNVQRWFVQSVAGSQMNVAVFPYHPRHSARENDITELILAFKSNDLYAVTQVTKVLREVLTHMSPTLRRDFCCRYILSAPPSRAHAWNEPCEVVARALAKHFTAWLTYVPHALERTDSVQKSSRAPRGQKPSYGMHFDSIRYSHPGVRPRRKGILLLDDVFTRGVTSGVCRDILIQNTGCAHVIGLFIGKTDF